VDDFEQLGHGNSTLLGEQVRPRPEPKLYASLLAAGSGG